MNGLAAIPGHVETKDAYGETTVVVERERLVEAAEYARDTLGFNVLADLTPTDYLGWGGSGVAGYWGSPPPSEETRGWSPPVRDINAPGSWGLQKLPEPKPKRFSVSYHLLALGDDPRRLRLQVWCEDEEPIPSVVSVWPTADWFEREAWDMMGIPVDGHPNLVRLLMDEDWEGHPLRKDYPLGGEPVRFSDEE
ncbi:MAG: NADH-quinone oxidoreductase subunit C [Thermoleophilia bacterium]|nr:NADH-quinone oxidoreductase subunit C [Thermoleophilia bacterium]